MFATANVYQTAVQINIMLSVVSPQDGECCEASQNQLSISNMSSAEGEARTPKHSLPFVKHFSNVSEDKCHFDQGTKFRVEKSRRTAPQSLKILTAIAHYALSITHLKKICQKSNLQLNT